MRSVLTRIQRKSNSSDVRGVDHRFEAMLDVTWPAPAAAPVAAPAPAAAPVEASDAPAQSWSFKCIYDYVNVHFYGYFKISEY